MEIFPSRRTPYWSSPSPLQIKTYFPFQYYSSESQLRFALFIKDDFITAIMGEARKFHQPGMLDSKAIVKLDVQSSIKKEKIFVIPRIFVNFAAHLQKETINE